MQAARLLLFNEEEDTLAKINKGKVNYCHEKKNSAKRHHVGNQYFYKMFEVNRTLEVFDLGSGKSSAATNSHQGIQKRNAESSRVRPVVAASVPAAVVVRTAFHGNYRTDPEFTEDILEQAGNLQVQKDIFDKKIIFY